MSDPVYFTNDPPKIDKQGAIFMMTITSGGEPMRFALTRHALRWLIYRSERAVAKAVVDELEAVVPFAPIRKQRRPRR